MQKYRMFSDGEAEIIKLYILLPFKEPHSQMEYSSAWN